MDWLRAEDEISDKLRCLMPVTQRQLGRGTELVTLRHANIDATFHKCQTLFLEEFITTYLPNVNSYMPTSPLIPRMAPKCILDLLTAYLMFIRPAAKYFAKLFDLLNPFNQRKFCDPNWLMFSYGGLDPWEWSARDEDSSLSPWSPPFALS